MFRKKIPVECWIYPLLALGLGGFWLLYPTDRKNVGALISNVLGTTANFIGFILLWETLRLQRQAGIELSKQSEDIAHQVDTLRRSSKLEIFKMLLGVARDMEENFRLKDSWNGSTESFRQLLAQVTQIGSRTPKVFTDKNAELLNLFGLIQSMISWLDRESDKEIRKTGLELLCVIYPETFFKKVGETISIFGSGGNTHWQNLRRLEQFIAKRELQFLPS